MQKNLHNLPEKLVTFKNSAKRNAKRFCSTPYGAPSPRKNLVFSGARALARTAPEIISTRSFIVNMVQVQQ